MYEEEVKVEEVEGESEEMEEKIIELETRLAQKEKESAEKDIEIMKLIDKLWLLNFSGIGILLKHATNSSQYS